MKISGKTLAWIGGGIGLVAICTLLIKKEKKVYKRTVKAAEKAEEEIFNSLRSASIEPTVKSAKTVTDIVDADRNYIAEPLEQKVYACMKQSSSVTDDDLDGEYLVLGPKDPDKYDLWEKLGTGNIVHVLSEKYGRREILEIRVSIPKQGRSVPRPSAYKEHFKKMIANSDLPGKESIKVFYKGYYSIINREKLVRMSDNSYGNPEEFYEIPRSVFDAYSSENFSDGLARMVDKFNSEPELMDENGWESIEQFVTFRIELPVVNPDNLMKIVKFLNEVLEEPITGPKKGEKESIRGFVFHSSYDLGKIWLNNGRDSINIVCDL